MCFVKLLLWPGNTLGNEPCQCFQCKRVLVASKNIYMTLKIYFGGLPLAVQWLRLCAPSSGSDSSIPSQGYMPPGAAKSLKKEKLSSPDHHYSSANTIFPFKVGFLLSLTCLFCPLMKFASSGMPTHLFTANTYLHLHKSHIKPHHLPMVFSYYCNLFIFFPSKLL